MASAQYDTKGCILSYFIFCKIFGDVWVPILLPGPTSDGKNSFSHSWISWAWAYTLFSIVKSLVLWLLKPWNSFTLQIIWLFYLWRILVKKRNQNAVLPWPREFFFLKYKIVSFGQLLPSTFTPGYCKITIVTLV